MPETNHIISVDNIHKSYGKIQALNGVSLQVPKGTILALLGPNGAGKTTLVGILTTLLKPNQGTATIAGIDVTKNPADVRSRIGLAGQFAAIDENLTGQENLELIGTLYHLPKNIVKMRAQKLLEEFALIDAARRPAKTYSGGMRRRLDVASSLIGEPEILFLDEPTTGLDPQSRNELWEIIEALVSRGTTVLLTTQYLEEADRLADNIVIIDNGKVIAQGTAKELKSKIGEGVLGIHIQSEQKIAEVMRVLEDFRPTANSVLGEIMVPLKESTSMLLEVIKKIDGLGIDLLDIELRKPSLDEVFLSLTTKKINDSRY